MGDKLEVKLCATPAQARNYKKENEVRQVWKRAKLVQACVIGQANESGGCDVDLIFIDDQGNKFFAIVSGGILKGLVSAINGLEKKGEALV